MRVRKKKNVNERIEKCGKYFINNPCDFKGKWKSVFGNDNPVHLEIGCGKGRFITEMAKAHKDINFVALEVCIDVLVLAVEKASFEETENVRFINADARDLNEIFKKCECERIYLNFSDPWPKKCHAKRRLTYKDFLEIYRNILPENGEIHFKTDNMKLFEFSLGSFSQNDFKMKDISLDLHNSGFEDNVMTEYERRFSDLGQPIYRLVAY